MKTNELKQMGKDEFALFIFNIGLNHIKNDNYDLFYDIHFFKSEMRLAIDHARNENNFKDYPTNKPVIVECTLYIRESGTHLASNKDTQTCKDHMLKNNNQAYELKFCPNYNYLRDIPFVEIRRIK